MTNTFTRSSTSTKIGARHITSKVMADLQSMKDNYGRPDESKIYDYGTELIILLAGGYLASVEYGFERNDRRIVTLRYTVQDGLSGDTKSGGVVPRADICNAMWFSFLEYSSSWEALSDSEWRQIKERIPIERTNGHGPQDGDGYWVTDKTYSSQGVGTQRRMFRPS